MDRQEIAVQLKPVGNNCNLNCAYCYVAPFRTSIYKVMNYATLEAVIRNLCVHAKNPLISWHGGEPTMAGISFFQEAQRLIDLYSKKDQLFRHVLQTNGTLITRDLAMFFRDHDYSVSISIDGDYSTHDLYRRDKSDHGSLDKILEGVNILRDYGINPSVMVTVTKASVQHPIKTFEFLLEQGFKRVKFSPVYDAAEDVFSIDSELWYEYLHAILHKWLELGDITIQVRELDEILSWLNNKSINVCSSKSTCFNWISIDPDGEVYPCEYFRSEMSYGNIHNLTFDDILRHENKKRFQKDFLSAPVDCLNCSYWNVCGNGCPATRVKEGVLDKQGTYVYCDQRKRLFREVEGILRSAI